MVDYTRLKEFLTKICDCSIEKIKEKILVDQDEYIEYKPEKIDDFEWYILQCKTRKWAEKISNSLYGWWICEDKKFSNIW